MELIRTLSQLLAVHQSRPFLLKLRPSPASIPASEISPELKSQQVLRSRRRAPASRPPPAAPPVRSMPCGRSGIPDEGGGVCRTHPTHRPERRATAATVAHAARAHPLTHRPVPPTDERGRLPFRYVRLRPVRDDTPDDHLRLTGTRKSFLLKQQRRECPGAIERQLPDRPRQPGRESGLRRHGPRRGESPHR